MSRHHIENHRTDRVGWLRASVLGANDGIVSTASLIAGFAASGADTRSVLLAGLAALVGGALSMAAGEYVSVSSQAATENADMAKEKRELEEMPEAELRELTHIYQQRGLPKDLAHQVAVALHEHDALGAHLRDELGISTHLTARPVQAALASAAAFAVGAMPPLLLAWLWRGPQLGIAISAMTLVLLGVLGALAGRLGGASMGRGAARVLVWGALAMAATAVIGRLFGPAVG